MSQKTYNILFYSNHSQDILSREILQELNKDPSLKEQFATFCVNTPGIKLPKIIIEKNEVPVIITSGFKTPISGEDALKWIRERNSGKAIGLDYGDVNHGNEVSQDHSILASESGRTSYHQSFNEDWNLGNDSDSMNINNCYSSIEDQNSLDTYEERGKHNTRGLRGELDKKLRQADLMRKRDVNPPLRRIGGDGPKGGLPLNAMQHDPINNRNMTNFNYGRENIGDVRNPMLPPQLQPVETKNRRDEQPGINYNPNAFSGGGNQNPMMGAQLGRPDNHFNGGQQKQQPMMRFPPPPGNNPLQPQGHPGMTQRIGGGGNPMMHPPQQQQQQNVPQLPPGFNNGGAGGSFSTLDGAFTGQSLMGTPMKNTNFHTRGQGMLRREQSLQSGLPSGRGHAGPFASAMNTSFQ